MSDSSDYPILQAAAPILKPVLAEAQIPPVIQARVIGWSPAVRVYRTPDPGAPFHFQFDDEPWPLPQGAALVDSYSIDTLLDSKNLADDAPKFVEAIREAGVSDEKLGTLIRGEIARLNIAVSAEFFLLNIANQLITQLPEHSPERETFLQLTEQCRQVPPHNRYESPEETALAEYIEHHYKGLGGARELIRAVETALPPGEMQDPDNRLFFRAGTTLRYQDTFEDRAGPDAAELAPLYSILKEANIFGLIAIKDNDKGDLPEIITDPENALRAVTDIHAFAHRRPMTMSNDDTEPVTSEAALEKLLQLRSLIQDASALKAVDALLGMPDVNLRFVHADGLVASAHTMHGARYLPASGITHPDPYIDGRYSVEFHMNTDVHTLAEESVHQLFNLFYRNEARPFGKNESESKASFVAALGADLRSAGETNFDQLRFDLEMPGDGYGYKRYFAEIPAKIIAMKAAGEWQDRDLGKRYPQLEAYADKQLAYVLQSIESVRRILQEIQEKPGPSTAEATGALLSFASTAHTNLQETRASALQLAALRSGEHRPGVSSGR